MKKEMEGCGREWITDSPGVASLTSVWDNLLQEGNGLFDLMSFSSWISTVWRINMREIKASGADSHFHLCVFLSRQTLMEPEVFTLSAWFTCAARGWISKGYRLPRCRAQQQQLHPACSCRRRPPGCSRRMCHWGARQGSAGLSQPSQHPCWMMCWTAGARTQRHEERSGGEQGKEALRKESSFTHTAKSHLHCMDCSGFSSWPGGEAQFCHQGYKWWLTDFHKIHLGSPLISAFPVPSRITQNKAVTWVESQPSRCPAQELSCTIAWVLDSFISTAFPCITTIPPPLHLDS